MPSRISGMTLMPLRRTASPPDGWRASPTSSSIVDRLAVAARVRPVDELVEGRVVRGLGQHVERGAVVGRRSLSHRRPSSS